MLPTSGRGRNIVILLILDQVRGIPLYLAWPSHCLLVLPFLLHHSCISKPQPAKKRQQKKVSKFSGSSPSSQLLIILYTVFAIINCCVKVHWGHSWRSPGLHNLQGISSLDNNGNTNRSYERCRHDHSHPRSIHNITILSPTHEQAKRSLWHWIITCLSTTKYISLHHTWTS